MASAYKDGQRDAARGHTKCPFTNPSSQLDWQRGFKHAQAVAIAEEAEQRRLANRSLAMMIDEADANSDVKNILLKICERLNLDIYE